MKPHHDKNKTYPFPRSNAKKVENADLARIRAVHHFLNLSRSEVEESLCTHFSVRSTAELKTK